MQWKPLRLVIPYLGKISLQTRTKLQKSTKRVTAVNYRLFLKFKIKSVIIFADKFQCTSFTSFSVDYAMNTITENVLDILL